MAKWRVHPTDELTALTHCGCKSWQNGGYIQQYRWFESNPVRCKSWQNGGYIQLDAVLVFEGFCCKSWQNGGYIQRGAATV